MTRLFPSRRPSTAANTVIKKSTHGQRTQSADGNLEADVAISTGTTPQKSPVDALKDMHVAILFKAIEEKLPCNSGLYLSAVETDLTLVMDIILGYATKIPDIIVWQLCSILEKLQKRSFSDGTFPDEVLTSQSFILKILAQTLDARLPDLSPSTFDSRLSSEPSTMVSQVIPPESSVSAETAFFLHEQNSTEPSVIRSRSMSTISIDLSPLHEKTVHYALDTLSSMFHYDDPDSVDGGTKELYPWDVGEWDPVLQPPSRVHKRRSGKDKVTDSPREPRNEGTDRARTSNQGQTLRVGRGDVAAADNSARIGAIPGGRVVQDAGKWSIGRKQYVAYAYDYSHDEALHGSYFRNVMVLIRRYATRVFFHLSVSNWPVVFDRIKARLHVMASGEDIVPTSSRSHFQSSLSWSSDIRKTSSEELMSGQPAAATGRELAGDVDLKFLGACLMDQTRLMAILQEYLSIFRDMSTTVQGTASLGLRNIILKWVVDCPQEFKELWTVAVPSSSPQSASTSASSGPSGRPSQVPVPSDAGLPFWKGRVNEHKGRREQLDDLAGRVFDMLHDSSREGSRGAVGMYPALAALICISPHRLESAIDALEGTAKASTKNNFLISLMHSLTTSTSSKLATSAQSFFACFEIVRFAFFIPPSSDGEREPSLRTIGAHIALELKACLINPPKPRLPFFVSRDPIAVNFYAYCIAAIFRFHPKVALLDLIQICLEPEKSQAVKLAVVKALVLLVVEASKYPWQPSLEPIFPIVTPRLRSILSSCSGDAEVIGGLRHLPSPFPTCSSVAAMKSKSSEVDLANMRDENLRLRVQIDTLFPLEPRSWLYGLTGADTIFLLNSARVGVHCDLRQRAAMVMALSATLTSSLNIPPNVSYYDEAMRYLLVIAPAAIVNAALMIINAISAHELLHMGINVMHTMLTQLAWGSIYDQDDAWRFSPDLMEAMILVETSLWCAITSSQMEISSVSRECLRLMSIIQRHPAFPLPPYLSEDDLHKRCAVLDSLGNAQTPNGGRFAVQKMIRSYVSLLTSYTPTQSLVFCEALARFSKLTQQLERSRLTQHNGHSVTSQAYSDQLYECQNVMNMMAVSARPAMSEVSYTIPKHLISLLPPTLQVNKGQAEMVNQFLEEVTCLLISEDVSLRQLARDALGNELSFELLPVTVNYFDNVFKKIYAQLQEDSQSDLHLLFTEQFLTIIKLTIERTDSSSTIFEDTASKNIIMTGLSLSRLPLNIRTIRLRALYCSAVNVTLVKRHSWPIHRVNELLHTLVETLADWIEQYLDLSSDGHHSNEFLCAISDAQLAALKVFVVAVETLRIQRSELVSNSDPRDHYRYIATLMKMLAPMKRQFDHASSLDGLPRKDEDSPNDALVYELVVSGIASLLNNNSELYKKFCLERCYDSEIHLRITFMKVFTRVLKLGHQFDQPQTSTPADSLCQMVRDYKSIALSIVQTCPPHDVEAILPVLMRVFNTRHALVDFLKTLIDLEVSGTASPSELFRSNTICNRMLSTFARQYGFVYLRSTLESLVNQIVQVPHGCSFELDPSKLRADEDAKENAQTLMIITQAFINVIVESVVAIPSVIREICHHIAEVVSNVWPESKYHAIGSFIFLRFICPAIVSPKTIDIDISKVSSQEYSAGIQRGLLLVAKIIQNLSNNVFFGKEAYLTVLNPFLERNVRLIAKFLSDIHILTYLSYEDDDDESFDTGYDDIDSLVLRRFLLSHRDKIGRVLGSQTRPNTGDGMRSESGREVWQALRTVLMRPAIEPPILSEKDTASHTRYQRFMRHNRDRNTDAWSEVFSLHSTVKGYVFVLTFAKLNVDTADFELFLYTILKTASVPVARNVDFDIIFDFTSFTNRSRPPNAWLRVALELLPLDVRRRWRSAYILNVNSDAQSFLSNIFYLFSGTQIARMATVISSVAELQRHFPEHLTIMATSYPASLESSQDIFEHIHQKINRCWTSVTLHVGADYLRTISAKVVELSPTLSSRVVELIQMDNVDDIHRSSCGRRLILKRSRCAPSVTLEYSDCDALLKCILAAKQRSLTTQKVPLLPASQTSDTRAILLAVGLLHACHSAEHVRSAAYELLTANCAHLHYPFDSQIPWRGSFIPANSLAFVINFSERISNFAPLMTLDFILQWSSGFYKATSVEKISCLQYISPWIRNMAMFTDHPSGEHFDESRVRDCIRMFVDITIQEPEIYPVLQRAIWIEIGRLPPAVLNIAIDELIQAAIDSGLDSWRCDIVADTLIPISTIHTRAKVLTRLRTTLIRAFSKPIHNIMDAAEWKHITVLTRLVLVAGHSPRLATQNQLYAPDIAHLVTMLCGIGSLSMRLSTYGLAVNLLQSLHMVRSDDGEIVFQLRQMLDDIKTPQALKLFGLDRHHPSSEISMLEPSYKPISTESLEKITEILLRTLELGSQSVGLSNVWRARWMSHLVSTTSQASSYAKFRTFTVCGKFPNLDYDDQAVVRMLLVFKDNLESSTQDVEGSVAILRCMRKTVPFLTPKSRYLGFIFWFTISIIQAEQAQLFTEVVQLLQATIETMEQHGLFKCDAPASQNPMAAVLMDARKPLWDAAVKLDRLSGASFETDFGFALTTVLWDAVRVPAHVKPLASVLMCLLKTSIRAANPKAEPRRSLDATSMPLYLGLCIFMDREGYIRLLEKDCHIITSSTGELVGEGNHRDAIIRNRIDPELLGISDPRATILAIAFVLCLEDSNLIETSEKENVYILWLGFVTFHPNIFLSGILYLMQYQTPDRLSHKMGTVFSPYLSESHYMTVNVAFQDLITRGDGATTTNTPEPGESSTSLENNNTVATPASELSFDEVLSECGMTGIMNAYRRPLRKKPDAEQTRQTIGYVTDLMSSLLSHISS